MRAAAVALASVVVMGGSVGVRGWSASAEPGLLPPVVVGEPAPRGLHLSEVAVGGDGTATLGWLIGTRSRRVQVATRAPGAAAFGPVHTLDPGGRWGPYAPSVAAAADGTAVAAWVAIAGDYDRAAVWAAIRPAGGTSFDPARRLTGVGRFPGLPRVALNDAGRAVVAWSGRRGVRAAVLAPGSRAFFNSSRSPQPAAGPGRSRRSSTTSSAQTSRSTSAATRYIVWSGIDKHYRYVVQSASLTAASAVFGATGRVVRVPGELWTFGAELDDFGNATVVWNASDFVHDDVAMVLRPVGGAFGQPVTLTPGGRQGVWPVIDSDGDSVAVVFSEWARRERGGWVPSWSGARPIAGLASTSLAGSRGTPERTIAVGPGGRTVVVWAGVGVAARTCGRPTGPPPARRSCDCPTSWTWRTCSSMVWPPTSTTRATPRSGGGAR